MTTEKNKPVAEIKIGQIVASIWENKSESSTRHNITLTRIYKKDGQWKRSSSFGPDDMLTLAAITDLVQVRILELTQTN